jgi:hypothetical protein
LIVFLTNVVLVCVCNHQDYLLNFLGADDSQQRSSVTTPAITLSRDLDSSMNETVPLNTLSRMGPRSGWENIVFIHGFSASLMSWPEESGSGQTMA